MEKGYVGELIRNERIKQGMSQQELADKAGVSVTLGATSTNSNS